MLTKQRAIEKLEALLAEWGRHLDGGLVLLPERTVHLPYGWMFFYTSRRFMETKDFRHAIAGNGPVVVVRDTSEVCQLGTALPAFSELAKFEDARGLRLAMHIEQRFSRGAIVPLSEADRASRCEELGRILGARMRESTNFHSAVASAISGLRELGHDLWSFDESDDMEAWGPNYVKPSGPGLVITFYSDDVVVEWSEH